MILEVVVAPNSGKFSISFKAGRLRISLRSPPKNNKANIELIKELSSLTGSSVRILSGQSSKRKKLEIGIDEDEWKKILSGFES